MKSLALPILTIILLISSCEKDRMLNSSESETDTFSDSSADSEALADLYGENTQAGQITAGEWSDLNNWFFWTNLLQRLEFSDKPEHWKIFTKNRISVRLTNKDQEILEDIKLSLIKGDCVIWESKTDNKGTAELWYNPYLSNVKKDTSQLHIKIEDYNETYAIQFFSEKTTTISLNKNNTRYNNLELAFIVDATGSMDDEIEFLKDDLEHVIQSVKNNSPLLDISTSTVFYRDDGDEYIVKSSPFTTDISNTINFIQKQEASGGGDYPEAVHTALETGINNLQWSEKAKCRIAFLLLDAPPHHNIDVISNIQTSIRNYSKKGIKIIPITASGINHQTEYIMRSMAILTNGTYVFLTDESGIGNEHLQASVGNYEVELLNDLMIRLITEYSE